MMRFKSIRRLGGLLAVGAVILQGCPLGVEEFQLAAANSLELFLSDLFSTAVNQLIDVVFNLDGGAVG